MSHVSGPFRRSKANRMIALAGAAFVLAGCTEVEQTAEDWKNKSDAAVGVQGVKDAIRSSVDEQAIEGAIKGAAANAIREELGVVSEVVDEDALVSGVGQAVNGDAVKGVVEQAARDAVQASAPPSAE